MENKENDASPRIIDAQEIMQILKNLPDNEEHNLHRQKFEDMLQEFKKIESKQAQLEEEKLNDSLLQRVIKICEKQINRTNFFIEDCNNFIQMADMIEPNLTEKEKEFLAETKERFIDLKETITHIQSSFRVIINHKIMESGTVEKIKDLAAQMDAYDQTLAQVKECYFSLASSAKKSLTTRNSIKDFPDGFLKAFNDNINRLHKKINTIENQSLRVSQESLTASTSDSFSIQKKRMSLSQKPLNGRKSDIFKTSKPVRTDSTLCLEKNDLESSYLQPNRSSRSSNRPKYHKDSEIKYLIDKMRYLQEEINYTQQQLSEALRRQNEIINDHISTVLSSKSFKSQFLANDHYSSQEDIKMNQEFD